MEIAGPAGACGGALIALPPISAAIRPPNDAGVSPAGSLVHCALTKVSGTSASNSVVVSIHTGTMNALLRETLWVRWSARSHSSRKYPSARACVCSEMIGINSTQSRICFRMR